MFYAKREEVSSSGMTVKHVMSFYTKRDRSMFLSKNPVASTATSKEASWSNKFGASFVVTDKEADMTYFVKVAG